MTPSSLSTTMIRMITTRIVMIPPTPPRTVSPPLVGSTSSAREPQYSDDHHDSHQLTPMCRPVVPRLTSDSLSPFTSPNHYPFGMPCKQNLTKGLTLRKRSP